MKWMFILYIIQMKLKNLLPEHPHSHVEQENFHTPQRYLSISTQIDEQLLNDPQGNVDFSENMQFPE